MSKLYCTSRNHVAIPEKTKSKEKKANNKKEGKKQTKKQKQQQQITAPIYITGGDAIRQLLWMIIR